MGWFLLGPWKSEGHFTRNEYPPKLTNDKSVKKYVSKYDMTKQLCVGSTNIKIVFDTFKLVSLF